MLSSTRSARLLFFAAIAAAGCGRSSLLGGYDEKCPPGWVRDVNGYCVPGPDGGFADMAGDGFGHGDAGDMARHDGAGDGSDMADMAIPCKDRKEICNNQVDDNCNGLVDCKDPACAGDQACVKKGQEICNNGIDDDDNGLVDCKDPACVDFPGCKPHMCDPNNPDCTDPACVDNPKCQDLVCKPTVDFGTLQKNDSKSEKVVSTVGTKDVALTPCAPGGGGMVVTEFTVASDATSVKLDFTQSMGADHVFALFLAGVNQKCDANPLGCYDPKSAPSGSHTWVLDHGHYYLIVQAFTPQHQGSADVTLSTPPSMVKEICNNGVDDDKNGLVDCQDPACFNDPHCANVECKPDDNVGDLVVGDPPKHTDLKTKGGKSRYVLTCAAGGGDDASVEFSLKETAGVLVDWQQTGDHVMGLFQLPPNGSACDAIPLGCYDPSGRPQDTVAWGELPPGHYLFIFQALKPGDEGQISADLSAYRNRKIELCHNGIDDDGNGLVDCADPACFQDPGCGSPTCNPDVNLGTLHLNDSKSTTVDTSTGILNEKLSCAKGNGKAKVIQVTLAENAGLGIQCTDVGQGTQNVEGLFAEGGPRDGCDKSEIECGDPRIIPFGCNYEVPNLQPGTYYVIVEAFQAGTEGKTNITLSSIFDRALEICHNGIDDDMDGFTDCADRKCATDPGCQMTQCRADASIDPMPLSGMPVDELVTTSGKMAEAKPPCEVMPGGGTAVVYINLPNQATVNIAYAQFGNHVFAAYPDLGPGLLCDSAKPLGCFASMGAGSGMVTLPNVPQGKYWLVVAADKPGDEGSVALRFTAM